MVMLCDLCATLAFRVLEEPCFVRVHILSSQWNMSEQIKSHVLCFMVCWGEFMEVWEENVGKRGSLFSGVWLTGSGGRGTERDTHLLQGGMPGDVVSLFDQRSLMDQLGKGKLGSDERLLKTGPILMSFSSLHAARLFHADFWAGLGKWPLTPVLDHRASRTTRPEFSLGLSTKYFCFIRILQLLFFVAFLFFWVSEKKTTFHSRAAECFLWVLRAVGAFRGRMQTDWLEEGVFFCLLNKIKLSLRPEQRAAPSVSLLVAVATEWVSLFVWKSWGCD